MKSAEEMFEELGYDMYAHKHSIEYVDWEDNNVCTIRSNE